MAEATPGDFFDATIKDLQPMPRTRIAWRNLEEHVRKLASLKWGRVANARTVNHVKLDSVIEIERDYWILIEITKEQKLDKLRIDLAKFAVVRPYLQSKGIYAKCYFITETRPTDALVETARGNNVTALSVEDFLRDFYDFHRYENIRKTQRFGSAVDPLTGEKDTSTYIPVKYLSRSRGADLNIMEIFGYLKQAKKVIVIGEYGTGKSRCQQELFSLLSDSSLDNLIFPIAIDLREMWGCQRGEEIIRRHFDNLGLSDLSDMALKVLSMGGLCILLDGFDELGAQVWSESPARLKQIRRQALSGVHDLLNKSGGAAIISGRDHYFNDDDEMFDALGLSPNHTEIIECRDDFTEPEATDFLKQSSGGAFNLPPWLPRRPLMLQTFARLNPVAQRQIEAKSGGEVEFCYTLIDYICDREARIAPILDKDTVKQILMRIARTVRRKTDYMSAISIAEVNGAFEEVVGASPVDENAVMLQRMVALGRVSSESNDRRFVDMFLLDGLLGMDVSAAILHPQKEIFKQKWGNPPREVGQAIIATGALGNEDSSIGFALKEINEGNVTLGMDVISAVIATGSRSVDLNGSDVSEAQIYAIDFSDEQILNGRITHSIIERLSLSNKDPRNFRIEGCSIQSVLGISSSAGLPSWIQDCTISNFESVSTISRIKNSSLAHSEIMFLTIIKKTFFQPGSGRKEAALLRGLGDQKATRYGEDILRLLVKEGILKKFPGNEGNVYLPQLKYKRRMSEIMHKLSLSDDLLWKKIGTL